MKGLSLCGGGSKGSYEMGAWDAFKLLNMNFNIVTGTSIGCLNGAMFVQKDYDRCEELWEKINIEHISNNAFDLDEVSIGSVVRHADFKPFIKEYIKGFGIDITPFKALLKEYVIPEKILKSDIKFGVVVSTFPLIRKEEVIISDLPAEDVHSYLLASASAFPVFPICKINGKQYIDGGYTDNLPIDLAFKMGAEHVVAVDLSFDVKHKHYVKHPNVDYIYPKWDLGSFLNFNSNILDKNRILGYFDVLKYYGKYDGYKYTFNKIKGLDNQASAVNKIITKDVIYLKDKKLKNFFKRENYINIYSLLSQHINKELRSYDYLLKCMEEVGDVLGIYPSELYTVKDFIKIIKTSINKDEINRIDEELNLIKKDDKKSEYIIECDKKLLLNYFYNKELSDNFRLLLLRSVPELYLCYVFLKTL
ncbi:MAG: patatin-like phospholipase family protein [bacterium]